MNPVVAGLSITWTGIVIYKLYKSSKEVKLTPEEAMELKKKEREIFIENFNLNLKTIKDISETIKTIFKKQPPST